jgi:hypothetical protein
MLVQRLHQGKSIPSGHCEVTYQYVRNLTPDCCQGLLRRLRGNSNRTKPSQKFRERLARIAMIFNDENPTPFKRARSAFEISEPPCCSGWACTVCRAASPRKWYPCTTLRSRL